MIKKLDKFIIRAFLGPFLATFSVLVFIFLMQFIMKYLDQLFGKNLGAGIYAELFLYFAGFMVPQAMPLAILLACLITYGSLGEHNELAAIKSAGISLIRVLAPIGVVVFIASIGLYFYNDLVLPKANLKAFSLLYDIKSKKVALDIKPKVFYYDLPGYTVKVDSKDPNDEQGLMGVIIYDHSDGQGNNNIIMAERGRMYTILQDKYLVLELFNGKNYSEVVNNVPSQEFVVNEFKRSKLVFNLSSFDMSRTNVDLFRSNKMMRNFKELLTDVDSLKREHQKTNENYKKSLDYYFSYYVRADTSKKVKTIKLDYNKFIKNSNISEAEKVSILSSATNQARNVKSFIQGQDDQLRQLIKDRNQYEVEAYKRFTSPFACFILFLIGAPLGAIIRKGGLGVPVLVGIIFFILFYLLMSNGEKAAKESQVLVPVGMIAGELILLLIGLFFLNQAWNDASIFDLDFYSTLFKQIFGKKSVAEPQERVINSLDDLTADDLK